MKWISVKYKLPELDELVLTTCEKMGEKKGEPGVIVARIMYDDYWYADFPYDQPVKPTHWMYFPKPIKLNKQPYINFENLCLTK